MFSVFLLFQRAKNLSPQSHIGPLKRAFENKSPSFNRHTFSYRVKANINSSQDGSVLEDLL